MTTLLAEQISHSAFGTAEDAVEIAVLGSTLLLTTVSGGQMALIQGTRRIGDLASVNVAGMLINTLVTIGGHTWLGWPESFPCCWALVDRQSEKKFEKGSGSIYPAGSKQHRTISSGCRPILHLGAP